MKMNKQIHLVVFCLLSSFALRSIAFSSTSRDDVSIFESPDKASMLTLTHTADPAVNRLTVSHSGSELTQYRFEGRLVSAYWSPSGEYVAINNHSGYLGWYLWVISLRDGSLIRAGGRLRQTDYNRYLDYDYVPDVAEIEADKITQGYAGFSSDHMREGYVSIAYGWKSKDELLMFHELIFSRLAEEQNAAIHLLTLFRVSDKDGITVEDGVVRKVTGSWSEQYPAEVKKVLLGGTESSGGRWLSD